MVNFVAHSYSGCIMSYCEGIPVWNIEHRVGTGGVMLKL